MNPGQLAVAIATPLIEALTAWLEGRGEEPPALVHLGVPESTMAEYRQRADAARRLRPAD